MHRKLATAIIAWFAIIAHSLSLPYDNAVAVVWTFENETWIENLAVRSNGAVLCTSINRAALYLVDPFEHTTITLHQFDINYGLLGITEVQNDVFVIASANVSLATSTAYPGSAKLWKVDMVAWKLGRGDAVSLIANLSDVGLPDGIVSLDSGLVLLADASRGIIWRVDANTGAYAIAIQDDVFLPTNPEIPLGVDGLHLLRGQLYFTNLSKGILGRIPLTGNGTAVGKIEIVANLTFPDDFAIAGDGTAFVAGDNTLYRVKPDGTVDILAGGPNSTVLEGDTSAQFGRTRIDRDVLYIGTNGGLLAPVNGVLHGGQLLAINTGLFNQ